MLRLNRHDEQQYGAEYETDDRVRQVAILRRWAANITELCADRGGMTSQEIVDYFVHETEWYTPSWYDKHDHALLVRFVDELLAE